MSALTAVYAILVALLLPFVRTRAHRVLCHLIVVWTSIIILTKMLYQLQQVHPWNVVGCNFVSLIFNFLYYVYLFYIGKGRVKMKGN
jgi:hypothetical protein